MASEPVYEERGAGESGVPAVVLLYFSAEVCGPCRLQDRVIEELKGRYKGRVRFEKIRVGFDRERDSELVSKYNVFGVPTMIIFKDGEADRPYKKRIGYTDERRLSADIDEALYSSDSTKGSHG